MARVVDRKSRDVPLKAAVPLLVSTSGIQTDEQVVAGAITKTSYVSVVTQAMAVPAGPRNGTSGGPVPPTGGVEPQPISARALVMHGVPKRMLVE